MNKSILGILLMSLGCGDDSVDSAKHDKGPVDGVCTEETVDHPDCSLPTDAGEFGSLESEIVLPAEYGATESYSPCARPFPGGKCYGANNKTFLVAFHPYSCLQTVGGQTGDWWYQMAWAGVKRSVDYLNDRGWNVSAYKLSEPPQFDWYHVDVMCRYDSVGSIGQASMHEGVDNIFDCHNTPNGQYCQYSNGNIYLRPLRAPTNPVWGTATSQQRKNMINNVVFHEFMHYAGLAHRAHNSNNMNIMMPAIQAWLSPQWTTLMVPDVNQSLAIYCYVPTSSTTPIVGCSG